MNVSFEKKDELNAIISVEIKNEDYSESINKQFKDYRKKAKVPGFRPGTMPLSMVKQMIGRSPDEWDSILMRYYFELSPKTFTF